MTGASGVGKDSIRRVAIPQLGDILYSVSATTREKRPGEVDGEHYHFVDHDRFREMIAAGEFFEYAEVHGDLKGTARRAVQPLLESGRDVLLEIDWQGARQVRAQHPDCRSIFILPPSRQELERRLRHRAQDSEATVLRRLANSRDEIAHAQEFDFIVVNDVFNTALDDIGAIIRAQRLSWAAQSQRQSGLISGLLQP